MITHHYHHAFTMIELLVVITVIAILAGMSLGGVKVVRESAKGSRCMNNLRQYGVAVQLYVNNFDGMLPPGALAGGVGDQPRYRAYGLPGMLIVNDFMELKVTPYSSANPCPKPLGNIFDCPAAWETNVSGLASNAHCSVASNANSDICQGFYENRYNAFGPYQVTSSYALNGIVNGSDPSLPFDELNSQAGRNLTKAMASLSKPSNLAMIFDGPSLFINGAIARIAARHANRTRTNVLFADGHVGTHATFQELQPQFNSNATQGDVIFRTQ